MLGRTGIIRSPIFETDVCTYLDPFQHAIFTTTNWNIDILFVAVVSSFAIDTLLDTNWNIDTSFGTLFVAVVSSFARSFDAIDTLLDTNFNIDTNFDTLFVAVVSSFACVWDH
jgi:hypothetical protein